MRDIKVINLNGVEYEVSYEPENNAENRIHTVKVLEHKDIYDHLLPEIQDSLYEKIHEVEK